MCWLLLAILMQIMRKLVIVDMWTMLYVKLNGILFLYAFSEKFFYKCAFLKTSKAAKILSKNNNNFFTATYYIFVFLGKWLSSFNCFWTYFLHEHVGSLLLSTTVHNLQIKLKKAINQLWIYNSRMEEGLLIFLWTFENKVCHGRPFSF